MDVPSEFEWSRVGDGFIIIIIFDTGYCDYIIQVHWQDLQHQQQAIKDLRIN